jgi:hypothetical protein
MVFALPIKHRRIILKALENGKNEKKGQKSRKK